MKIQMYLFLIFIVTLVALGTWLLILFNINPYDTDLLSIASFFASMYLWISGLLTLISFYLKIKLSNREIIYNHLPISIRQASLISLAFITVLIISSLGIFTWWSGILIVISILILELFFRTKKYETKR